MAHSTSAILSAIIAVLIASAMFLLRNQLGDTKFTTILGGFLGSNVFLFLLTALSNVEMEIFGDGFQSKLFPEVAACLLIACLISAMVHRVSVTTCILFSLGMLYMAYRAGNRKYAAHTTSAAQALNTAAQNKKRR